MLQLFKGAGPMPAKIMIVSDYPTLADEQGGMPLAGGVGFEFGKMLQEAGIQKSQCFITHAIRARPLGDDISQFVAFKKKYISQHHIQYRGRHVLPIVKESVEMLQREIEMCQPNVIIALGEMALWALTSKQGIHKWRGSEMQTDLPLALEYKPKVVPVIHPRGIMAMWSWRWYTVHDLKRAAREAGFRRYNPTQWNFTLRPTFLQVKSHLHQLINFMIQGEELDLGIDIETRAGYIACIALAHSKQDAICIPFMCVENAEGYWTAEEEGEIVTLLKHLLLHPNLKRKFGQNFNYDNQYISERWFFTIPDVWDTMVFQHFLKPNSLKSLDFLSSLYCDWHYYWKDDGKEWDVTVPEEEYWNYNCVDACRTFEIGSRQLTLLPHLSTKQQEACLFQQKLQRPVLEMMLKGLRADIRRREQYLDTLQHEIAERHQWLVEVTGGGINPRSPKNLQDFFHEDLKLPRIKSRKTGNDTLDDQALERLGRIEPIVRPITQKILELRSLGVFLSTYVMAPLPPDLRYRCSFKTTGTETFRFASSKDAFGYGLNLQNIPSGREDDGLILPNMRELFLPDPDHIFFDIDLSSADLRIVVWEADEGEMKDMLRQGLDPYTEIAKEFYHDRSITKKDPRRQTFKGFAHGTHYLGTPEGLAANLGLSVQEATRTQKWYFGKFPNIKKWQDDMKLQITKRGWIENIFGYRIQVIDRVTTKTFNEMAAWLPQSTVACLINRGLMNLYENHRDMVTPLLQVHDSLGGQFHRKYEEVAPEIIKRACQVTLPYADPLIIPVDINISHESWGKCKD